MKSHKNRPKTENTIENVVLCSCYFRTHDARQLLFEIFKIRCCCYVGWNLSTGLSLSWHDLSPDITYTSAIISIHFHTHIRGYFHRFQLQKETVKSAFAILWFFFSRKCLGNAQSHKQWHHTPVRLAGLLMLMAHIINILYHATDGSNM